MDYKTLWNNKKAVAKNSMKMKERVHGIECQVEYLKGFEDIYGEESGQKRYYDKAIYKKLVFTGIMSTGMLSYSQIISSTEQEELYIQRFEEEALPRNTRVHVPQGEEGNYRILEVRDTMTNAGTFLVTQHLVPTIVQREEFNEQIGKNILPDKVEKGIGRNIL